MNRRSNFFTELVLLVACLLLLAGAASAQTANTGEIAFTRPTTYLDGTTPLPAGASVSYNVYQAECPVITVAVPPSSPLCTTAVTGTKVATLTTTGGSITTGLQGGKNYCWRVTAFITGQEPSTENNRSNEACKSFATPGTFTITVR